jgi:hypothetical protein
MATQASNGRGKFNRLLSFSASKSRRLSMPYFPHFPGIIQSAVGCTAGQWDEFSRRFHHAKARRRKGAKEEINHGVHGVSRSFDMKIFSSFVKLCVVRKELGVLI